MATWSHMRKKLEEEYLAESLRGHIQYYATRYREDHDQEGSAAIRLDGKELIRGCWMNQWSKALLFPHDETYPRRLREEMAYTDETALKLGVFDQRSFYKAFYIFDNQNIEQSLSSDNLLVRIFAVLDRRTGKRRLARLGAEIKETDQVFRLFYTIRLQAEGMLSDSAGSLSPVGA